MTDPVSRQGLPAGERPPEYRYHLLRAALATGLPGLPGLGGPQLTQIARRADSSFELESLALTLMEADPSMLTGSCSIECTLVCND